MRFLIIIILIGGIMAILVGATARTYDYFYEKDIIAQSLTNMENITQLKAERIQDIFNEIENDIISLKESEEVKDIFKQELGFNKEAIEADVSRMTKIIAKEIENYIKIHPWITLKELQDSPEFKQIAIQPVGKDGYSAVNDYEKQIIVMHKFDEFIGKDYEEFKELPEIYEIQIKSINNPDVSGFYDWKEPNGSIRRKYIHFIHVEPRTADGVGLMVGITAYIDDYTTVRNVSEKYLEDFNQIFDYDNLLLISPEGQVIYETKQKEGYGTNLEWEANLHGGLSKGYFNAKKSENVSFYGPFIEHYGEIYAKVSVMSKVYAGEEFLGIIALIADMKNIDEITQDLTGLGETGQTYLIDNERILVTPLRFGGSDIFVQRIKSENAEKCFKDSRVHEEDMSVKSVKTFLDYKGDLVHGANAPIPKINLCILTEIEKEEVLKAFRERSKRNIIITLGTVFIFITISIFTKIALGKTYILKKKKNRARLDKEDKFFKFFKNLKLRYLLLFDLIFCIGYFFLITSFFQGWQNAKLFDAIPDLVSIAILFLIIFYSSKLKNLKSKKFIFIGALFFVFGKLIEIPVQEYQLMIGGSLNPFNFLFDPIMVFLGSIYLIFGLRRLSK